MGKGETIINLLYETDLYFMFLCYLIISLLKKNRCENHRMAWIEKDHNNHPVPTPCYVQGRQPPDQAAQSHSQPGESVHKHFEMNMCMAQTSSQAPSTKDHQ